MRVLDIDLDFFLKGACPLAERGERPPLAGHEPWPEDKVRKYLARNLGLERQRKIPGRVFETHDGSLVFWQEMIGNGFLTAPFEIIHVDTHSDLGIGKPGPGLVLNGALCQSFPSRTDIAAHYAKGHLDEANYLLFALSMRYCSKLTNIRNTFSHKDLPEIIVAERDGRGRPVSLQLRTNFPSLFEAKNGVEPVIQYSEYMDPKLYKDEGQFDFMTVAISPRYAPEEADILLPVLREYMTII